MADGYKIRSEFIDGIQVSLTELSERSGIERSHLSRIVRGQRCPNVMIFHKLARSLNTTMDKLFKSMYQF